MHSQSVCSANRACIVAVVFQLVHRLNQNGSVNSINWQICAMPVFDVMKLKNHSSRYIFYFPNLCVSDLIVQFCLPLLLPLSRSICQIRHLYFIWRTQNVELLSNFRRAQHLLAVWLRYHFQRLNCCCCCCLFFVEIFAQITLCMCAHFHVFS